jgi:DNA-binding winged helix-turn-helix (wHTH) protein
MSVDTIAYAQARQGRQAAEAQRPAIRPFVSPSSMTEKIGLASASSPIRLAREPDFHLGALTIRPSLCEVSIRGGRQRLQPRVMQVLVALARAEDRVVSRDALIESCWGGRIVGEDSINRCIGRLRRLGETCEDGFSIETLARVGYRLTAAEVCEPFPVAASTAKASGLRGAFALVVAALAIGAGAVLASR